MSIHIAAITGAVITEVAERIETALTANPEASKDAVEAAVVAAADKIEESVEAELGIGPIAEHLVNVPLNALIAGAVGKIYDLVKAKLDALAKVPAPAV